MNRNSGIDMYELGGNVLAYSVLFSLAIAIWVVTP